MDNSAQNDPTEKKAEPEDTEPTNTPANPNETKTSDSTIPSIEQDKSTATSPADTTDTTESSNALITSNVESVSSAAGEKTASEINNNTEDISSGNNEIIIGSDTVVATIDRVPDTVGLETNRKNAINSSANEATINTSVSVAGENYCASDDRDTDKAVNKTNDEISKLDAALDSLNDQVASLLEDDTTVKTEKAEKSESWEAPIDAALAKLSHEVEGLVEEQRKLQDERSAAKSEKIPPAPSAESWEAPIDEALANLNNEVLGLLKESRKIQDELRTSESRELARCSSPKNDKIPFFDPALYRESSQSPPPHPPVTYRWEDIRREKEKGGYPWTYLNPQELAQVQANLMAKLDKQLKESIEVGLDDPVTEELDEIAPTEFKLPASILQIATPEAAPSELFPYNFDSLDTQRAIDTYSSKSSVKNSSSGILEVLHELETEAQTPQKEKTDDRKCSTTQSHQDLSTTSPKEKKSMFKSLLKRTHSAPKKIQITKTSSEESNSSSSGLKPPSQVKCCHPIVEKLKTMADKQLHKKTPPKKPPPPKIKKVAVPNEQKIVLAEQTRIIRLKDSPKAEHKNVAAFLEKRDSDDVVEIFELDESPGESRKRREENRQTEDTWKDEESLKSEEHSKSFVVPANVTEAIDTEPTVEELLEEEFKNDPPKKSPRKPKEHIYEEIAAPASEAQDPPQKPPNKLPRLGRAGKNFAAAVLHSVLNKSEFKENLKKQNELEDAAESVEKEQKKLYEEEPANDKPVPFEIIELNTTSDEPDQANELKSIEEEKSIESDAQEEIVSDVKIKIERANTIDKAPSEEVDVASVDSKKDVLTKEEKKVTFSQSTEEYQEKIAAERAPDKEDVELPEHIQTSKRWSNMSDHEYEPIGPPVTDEAVQERPIVRITEPEALSQPSQPSPDLSKASADEITQFTERSITPFTDISRTEELHTSQIDDSVIEEVPLRREDRKKKSFMTNAGEHTRNLQHKISSQASNLRTKFKRSIGSNSSNQKASGPNLKSSLKSSPKSSQASPKERKKFKRVDFTNKLKAIHMPKMPKPELPKFKVPEKFKRHKTTSQSEATDGTPTTITIDETTSSVIGSEGTPTTVTITTTGEMIETKPSKKLFEFGSYPKILNRFKTQKDDQHDAASAATDFASEETDREQASTSSFATHFATVPRTASKIKNSIMSKWAKTTAFKSSEREESDSLPRGSSMKDSFEHPPHEDSVERRMRLATKISMDEEEEPLGILQTKEQIQLASYDEENRAIHEISKAREGEFKARKPLTHQDSDLVSEESNRDIDWEECERMRNKILGGPRSQASYMGDEPPKKEPRRGRRKRTDSNNFSTEETQSSGSSCDRRRTGVIEDIDDDEFFLRQRGVSQDNAEISQYISSAIREGLSETGAHRNGLVDSRYSDDSYNRNNAEYLEEYRFEEKPKKPFRRFRNDGFNRSYESSDDFNSREERARQNIDDFTFENYHRRDQMLHARQEGEDVSDNELPVATQYFPNPDDDENISFYDNEFADEVDRANILTDRDVHGNVPFDSDIENEERRRGEAKPKVPKRRRKGPVKQDSLETNEEVLVYRSEPSFLAMDDEPLPTPYISKPVRKNRSISSKSDIANEPAVVESYSPNNSRYTINLRDTNGYATVKKEPKAPGRRPPAPARRRKRSTKSLGEARPGDISANLLDSPYPERPHRNYNVIVPSRPPRHRGSNSSLADHPKTPSIAASDITQYEEIDDIDLNDESNLDDALHRMQSRPLPAPPRPPRDKKRRRKSSNKDEKKFDDDNDAELIAQSFDDGASEFSAREFIGAEMATQTSFSIEADDYLNDNIDDASDRQPTRTVEEILRSTETQPSSSQPNILFKTSDDNLSKGIQKFRESNQRSYSERSRTSADRPITPISRPLTPSAMVIEQRVARSPVQTDATLIMQPVDEPIRPEYHIDDTVIDTDDERIISAAIRRYQMLDDQSPVQSFTQESTEVDDSNVEKVKEEERVEELVEERVEEEPPIPPPRRKSSVSTVPFTETLEVPLAQSETVSVSSSHDLNRFTPERVNDLSVENVQPIVHDQNETIALNIRPVEREINEVTPAQPENTPISSGLQITPEVLQEIIERVRETLPIPPQSEPLHPPPSVESSVQTQGIDEKEITKETAEKTEEAPKRPPTPTDYTPSSEIPASFYRLRTGISDEESLPLQPPLAPIATQRHRSRKHTRRCESSSEDEECHRRHHHHSHHHSTRVSEPESTIAELSGQLIRAVGRALSSTLNTAGNSLLELIRSLTNHQDEKQRDVSIVLMILIVIVASLMMLGISGDRSVHHHHWDYFNPPDNLGRR